MNPGIVNGFLVSNVRRYKHGYLQHFQERIFAYFYPSSPQPPQRGVVLPQRVLLTLLLRNVLDQAHPENNDILVSVSKTVI